MFSNNAAYKYEELAELVHDTLSEHDKMVCLGITLTGNGLQIYLNKYGDLPAAPVINSELSMEALFRFGVRVLDVNRNVPIEEIVRIVDRLLDPSNYLN